MQKRDLRAFKDSVVLNSSVDYKTPDHDDSDPALTPAPRTGRLDLQVDAVTTQPRKSADDSALRLTSDLTRYLPFDSVRNYIEVAASPLSNKRPASIRSDPSSVDEVVENSQLSLVPCSWIEPSPRESNYQAVQEIELTPAAHDMPSEASTLKHLSTGRLPKRRNVMPLNDLDNSEEHTLPPEQDNDREVFALDRDTQNQRTLKAKAASTTKGTARQKKAAATSNRGKAQPAKQREQAQAPSSRGAKRQKTAHLTQNPPNIVDIPARRSQRISNRSGKGRQVVLYKEDSSDESDEEEEKPQGTTVRSEEGRKSTQRPARATDSPESCRTTGTTPPTKNFQPLELCGQEQHLESIYDFESHVTNIDNMTEQTEYPASEKAGDSLRNPMIVNENPEGDESEEEHADGEDLQLDMITKYDIGKTASTGISSRRDQEEAQDLPPLSPRSTANHRNNTPETIASQSEKRIRDWNHSEHRHLRDGFMRPRRANSVDRKEQAMAGMSPTQPPQTAVKHIRGQRPQVQQQHSKETSPADTKMNKLKPPTVDGTGTNNECQLLLQSLLPASPVGLQLGKNRRATPPDDDPPEDLHQDLGDCSPPQTNVRTASSRRMIEATPGKDGGTPISEVDLRETSALHTAGANLLSTEADGDDTALVVTKLSGNRGPYHHSPSLCDDVTTMAPSAHNKVQPGTRLLPNNDEALSKLEEDAIEDCNVKSDHCILQEEATQQSSVSCPLDLAPSDPPTAKPASGPFVAPAVLQQINNVVLEATTTDGEDGQPAIHTAPDLQAADGGSMNVTNRTCAPEGQRDKSSVISVVYESVAVQTDDQRPGETTIVNDLDRRDSSYRQGAPVQEHNSKTLDRPDTEMATENTSISKSDQALLTELLGRNVHAVITGGDRRVETVIPAVTDVLDGSTTLKSCQRPSAQPREESLRIATESLHFSTTELDTSDPAKEIAIPTKKRKPDQRQSDGNLRVSCTRSEVHRDANHSPAKRVRLSSQAAIIAERRDAQMTSIVEENGPSEHDALEAINTPDVGAIETKRSSFASLRRERSDHVPSGNNRDNGGREQRNRTPFIHGKRPPISTARNNFATPSKSISLGDPGDSDHSSSRSSSDGSSMDDTTLIEEAAGILSLERHQATLLQELYAVSQSVIMSLVAKEKCAQLELREYAVAGESFLRELRTRTRDSVREMQMIAGQAVAERREVASKAAAVLNELTNSLGTDNCVGRSRHEGGTANDVARAVNGMIEAMA